MAIGMVMGGIAGGVNAYMNGATKLDEWVISIFGGALVGGLASKNLGAAFLAGAGYSFLSDWHNKQNKSFIGGIKAAMLGATSAISYKLGKEMLGILGENNFNRLFTNTVTTSMNTFFDNIFVKLFGW